MSRPVRAVLFDLDDTLYPEREFVHSGFRAVAAFLSARVGVAAEELAGQMDEILERQGRGRVFDEVLERLAVGSQELVQACLHVYRSHRPQIRLFEEAAPVLIRLRQRGLRLGIVTDGMGAVQRSKLDALELHPLVDAVVLSDLLGPGLWKPAAEPYRVALAMLDARPDESVYVGDNPAKDFLWPNAAGMLTVQLVRGADPGSGREEPGAPGRPALEIASLRELPALVEG